MTLRSRIVGIAAICATASFTGMVFAAGIAAACEGGGSECGFEKPSVTTEAATSVTNSGAVLHGKVNPNGCLTTYLFEWGPTEKYGSSIGGSAGSGKSAVSKEQLAAATPNTLYHFRISATNFNGTSYGADKTFTTLPKKPSITTGSATEVTKTTAVLHGLIVPNHAFTTYYFKYGLTETYGKTTEVKGAGSGTAEENVGQEVKSLTAGTKYHFRIIGENAGGTVEGSDATFTTSP